MKNSERGEVMLEGMIVTIITVIMLIWVLGVGFLYYQRYVVRIVTNDATKKIAATYQAPTTDIIMGYISADDMKNRMMYKSSDLSPINQDRAESYVRYILKKSNFAGTVQDVHLELEYVGDSMARGHVKVTTTCTFQTPFGLGLSHEGMNPLAKYSVTSYADATNISQYVSYVSIADAFTNGTLLKGTGLPEKVLKMINSIGGCIDKWTH